MRTGVPTFSLPATNNLSLLSPSFGGALSLPYLFRSEDELYALMKAPIWEEFQKKLTKEAGAKALAMGVVGFRWILNSKRPIVTVADIKGLKLRVPDVPQYIAAYKSWGVPPTPMAWNETPAALQQGVIDGLDNAVGTHLAFKFYESAKYLTEINYALLTCPLIMGATQFEQQPPNVRDAIVQAAKDAQSWEYRTYKYTKQIDIKALEAHGVKVNKIKGEEDLERMARSTWPELAARSGGSDWVKRVSEAVANIRRQ